MKKINHPKLFYKILKLTMLLMAVLYCFPLSNAHYVTFDGSGVQVFFDKEPPVQNEKNIMNVLILNESKKPITDLDLVHERKLHVFVVGSDLNEFYHIHPEDFSFGFENQSRGIYKLEHEFQKAGIYAVVVDYTYREDNHITSVPVKINGSSYLDTPNLDLSRKYSFEDYQILLEAEDEIIAGAASHLMFNVFKNGKQVSDFEEPLGSKIHVLAIEQSLSKAHHGHYHESDSLESSSGHSMNHAENDPRIPVEIAFEQPGIYAVFAQIQHEGKIITSKFMIDVKESKTEMKRLKFLGKLTAITLAIAVVILLMFKFYRKTRK